MLEKRLEKVLDSRASTAHVCGSWRLSALMVLAIMVTQISGSGLECCPENATWVGPHFNNCTDGSNVRLHCPYGQYALDPTNDPEDEFFIVERNGAYMEFNLSNIEGIPASSFCLAGDKYYPDHRALVCFTTKGFSWIRVVCVTLCLVSVIFFFLTLAVYVVLPELRDIQDKIMVRLVFFLGVGYFVLAVTNLDSDATRKEVPCVFIGFAMYWTFISAFFWMNIGAFNVCRSVWFTYFSFSDNKLFLAYCVVGFTGPAALLMVALVADFTDGDHLKPDFGVISCFFDEPLAAWTFFYGPIGVLLFLNVIYLSLTSWKLWVEYGSHTGSRRRILQFNCSLCVKLVFLMGITWIFEIASYADYNDNSDGLSWWFVTDVLNYSQGVAMFVLLVVMRPRVKKLLAERKPFGLRFPSSWAD